jgi:hypothetical protein
VRGGTETATIALLGQYAASSFAAASEARGGTVITDPGLTAQNHLAPPHT